MDSAEDQLSVCDYDATWPDQFAELAARINSAMGGLAVKMEHIGSTAVPGLAAKPIIDLDVVLASPSDLPETMRRLSTIGYVHEGDIGISGREAFISPPEDSRHHLYALTADAEELRRHMTFRDVLRADSGLRDTYASLKRSLSETHFRDRGSYTRGKTAFITSTLQAAHSVKNL